MKNNIQHKGKVIVGDLREKLKAKLKELIRQHMKEISTSGAAGGSPADGSAGPVKTPYAFGKVKDPTTGLDGYKQVGKNNTGTINEKKKKDDTEVAPKSPKAPKKASSSGTPYTPEVLPAEKRLKALQQAADDAASAAKKASHAADTVNKLASARKKAMQHGKENNA